MTCISKFISEVNSVSKQMRLHETMTFPWSADSFFLIRMWEEWQGGYGCWGRGWEAQPSRVLGFPISQRAALPSVPLCSWVPDSPLCSSPPLEKPRKIHVELSWTLEIRLHLSGYK